VCLIADFLLTAADNELNLNFFGIPLPNNRRNSRMVDNLTKYAAVMLTPLSKTGDEVVFATPVTYTDDPLEGL